MTALENTKVFCLTTEEMRSHILFYDNLYNRSRQICEERGVNILSVKPKKLPARRVKNWKNQFAFETKKDII